MNIKELSPPLGVYVINILVMYVLLYVLCVLLLCINMCIPYVKQPHLFFFSNILTVFLDNLTVYYEDIVSQMIR